MPLGNLKKKIKKPLDTLKPFRYKGRCERGAIMICLPLEFRKIQNTSFLFSKECPFTRKICVAIYNCVTVTCEGYCGHGGFARHVSCNADSMNDIPETTTEWRDR